VETQIKMLICIVCLGGKMATTSINRSENQSVVKLAALGAIAGIGGGVVFGMMMAMMGMLPMVAMLVGSESVVLGWIVHLTISAFIGAVYGVVAGRFPNTATIALVGGILNGSVWWVLGALILMPLMLGMNEMVLVVGGDQWMSLIGHIIYGLITAFLLIPLRNRA
jgi:uncharacterized membrane protein YagU involved in acid resistance